MELRPEFKNKPVRSFVIRGGRITDAQRTAFERWWPAFGLSLHAGAIQPQEVFARPQPVVMEIGFGMGDSLLAMASQSPDTNFLGVEVHPPGVGRLINNAGKAGLSNLRVYMADAKDVMEDCIPDGSLSRVQIYFPDPWHKKKHHKRRIVQPEFVALIASKLHSDGLLHLATDWHEYAEHMLAVLQSASGLRNTVDGFAPRPQFRPKTKFESRGERLGHGVWDLLFRKT